MRWEDQRRSDNVEDRRGMRVPGGAAGGGIGTIVIVLLISWITGVNPLTLFQVVGGLGGGDAAPVQEGPTGAPTNDPQAEFAAVVLADTEDTWGRVFQQAGKRYQPPTLVLFSDAVQSACGTNSAAVGPFYCPADQKVYIDLGFFRELDQQFGAPGDFAQAYVIAHEVGHHVQTLLGISERVMQLRQRRGRGRGQPAVGAAGAAGRLLRRRVGASRQPQEPARRRRRRGGPAARRRRSATTRCSARSQGRVVARVVDPRVVGAARRVAAPRAHAGHHRRLRHLRPAVALSATKSSRAGRAAGTACRRP